MYISESEITVTVVCESVGELQNLNKFIANPFDGYTREDLAARYEAGFAAGKQSIEPGLVRLDTEQIPPYATEHCPPVKDKIAAIKLLRSIFPGLGLKESKHIVEALAVHIVEVK